MPGEVTGDINARLQEMIKKRRHNDHLITLAENRVKRRLSTASASACY